MNDDWAEGTTGRRGGAGEEEDGLPRRAAIDPMRGSLPSETVGQDVMDDELLAFLSEDGYSVEAAREGAQRVKMAGRRARGAKGKGAGAGGGREGRRRRGRRGGDEEGRAWDGTESWEEGEEGEGERS